MVCGVNPNLKTNFPCSYKHFHAQPIPKFDPPVFYPHDMGSEHFYKDLRPLSIELCITQTSTWQQKQNSAGYKKKKKVFSNLNLFVTCKTFATFFVQRSDHRTLGTKKVMQSGSYKFAEIKCGMNNNNNNNKVVQNRRPDIYGPCTKTFHLNELDCPHLGVCPKFPNSQVCIVLAKSPPL